MEKLLLRARRPSIGLKWLDDLGVTTQLFPELQALTGVPQEKSGTLRAIVTSIRDSSLIARANSLTICLTRSK
jgi:tRNA nucleotidyltransferase/poly(A) polymerase